MSLVKFGFHGVLIISGLVEANQAGRSRDKGNVKLLNRNIKYLFKIKSGSTPKNKNENKIG